MSSPDQNNGVFRVSALPTRRPTRFELTPSEDERAALAAELGLSQLRKLRFEGEIKAMGKRGWELTGLLGATVVQPCVVTLQPVVTRIDEEVTRRYDAMASDYEAGSETEMPEDDTTEPLGDEISARLAMIEALSLALPTYPRAENAELEDAVFTEAGIAPMTDDDAKPFAGLKALRDSLGNKDKS